MDLTGKTILFLGDSITEGMGLLSAEHTYWQLLGRNTGATVVGYGMSGTNIAPQRCRDVERLSPVCFCTRVPYMQPQADVVVVFGGTNDFGGCGDVAMGDMSDREPDTFYGALHTLYISLQEKYPEAEMVIMTPLHRVGEENRYNELGIRNAGVLEEYVVAIRQVAAYYGLPVLDLYAMSGLCPAVPIRQKQLMPDGLHPNEAGHRLIASRLEGFLRSL